MAHFRTKAGRSRGLAGRCSVDNGVEVQMLELEWPNLNKVNGVTPPIAYVHGELFGVGGVKTVPDNPRGERSKSIENRCKGKGEWNVYDVVAVDGVIKLAVNGKFVNGIQKSTQKKGYLCLESEGAVVLPARMGPVRRQALGLGGGSADPARGGGRTRG